MDVDVLIKVSGAELTGKLNLPKETRGLVIFSITNRQNSSLALFVSKELNKQGIGTMLFNLFSKADEKREKIDSGIDLLTDKLVGVTKWCMDNEKTRGLSVGYWGVGLSAGAALSAAAYWGGSKIKAVVSVLGRPDLTGEVLDLVETPTLLIVSNDDKELIDRNRQGYIHLGCEKKTEIVAGSSFIFEENEVRDRVTELTVRWFLKHF